MFMLKESKIHSILHALQKNILIEAIYLKLRVLCKSRLSLIEVACQINAAIY